MVHAAPTERDWIKIPIPPTLRTEQSVVVPPTDWDAFDGATGKCPSNVDHRLVEIKVYDGHPRDCAVVPQDDSHENKSQNFLVYRWDISSWPKNVVWIGCRYSSTRILICRPLPKSAKEIRITYSTEIPGRVQPSLIEYR
jgi:hypothetical protein